MRFASFEINGAVVQHSELTFSQLTDFMKGYVFDAFMDRGRSGIRGAAADIVDNFELYACAKNKGLTKYKIVLSEQERGEIVRFAAQELMNTFITNGTNGLVQAQHAIYQLVYNALTDSLGKKLGV